MFKAFSNCLHSFTVLQCGTVLLSDSYYLHHITDSVVFVWVREKNEIQERSSSAEQRDFRESLTRAERSWLAGGPVQNGPLHQQLAIRKRFCYSLPTEEKHSQQLLVDIGETRGRERKKERVSYGTAFPAFLFSRSGFQLQAFSISGEIKRDTLFRNRAKPERVQTQGKDERVKEENMHEKTG
ncbi:hypothetical protein Baya_13733 [Bagarius yarrelli]|uniref:Uncharacterized protein n=1 Tax=Bagarius yarrelli TaxID=175774 RepID=A0A556V6X7_BAGYA|nr:hypothetical protein Baya_13733 [Bagarius yarrelli]